MGSQALWSDNMDLQTSVLGNDQIQVIWSREIANHRCVYSGGLVCRYYIIVGHVLPGKNTKTQRSCNTGQVWPLLKNREKEREHAVRQRTLVEAGLCHVWKAEE